MRKFSFYLFLLISELYVSCFTSFTTGLLWGFQEMVNFSFICISFIVLLHYIICAYTVASYYSWKSCSSQIAPSKRNNFSNQFDIFNQFTSLSRNSPQIHCVKSPYSELFWSVFSYIWTAYREIRSISSYSARMRENTDLSNFEYGHFSRCDPCQYVIVLIDLQLKGNFQLRIIRLSWLINQ